MFERFSEHARHVMSLENRVAQGFHHHYLGTEHLLLGLLREKEGVAAITLNKLGVDRKKARAQIEKLVQAGPMTETESDEFHQTERLKKVIHHSVEECRRLKHSQIGTEHLLLGLLMEPDGVAVHALQNLGLDIDTVKIEVTRLLEQKQEPAAVE